ncbi:DMT family transporter [Nitratireductor luteus]|uniref:DMT family transporter n=1 Tax=Nitratireductor luteus TaxID=2976980 RepID=UPI0022408700|nr:DMT family transporter [Nitratireductor luteus]
MTRIQANLLLLTAGAMWGMGFVAQSTAMEAIGPLLFIGLRFAVAGLAMLPFALRESRNAAEPLAAHQWRAFLMIGVLLFGGMTSQQVGLLTTTVTNSGFLTGLYVVMVPFFGVILFRQWPHRIVWPATLCALAGIWLLSGGGAVALRIGDWLTILCAAFWALQVIFIQRSAAGTGRPVTLAVTQFAVTAIIALALAFAFEPVDMTAIRLAAPEILYAGIFSGGIAFTLQVIGQRYTTAPQAAIFLSTEAVFAALFAAVFLSEQLPASGFAGCVLIFSAILMVEIVPALRRPRQPAG